MRHPAPPKVQERDRRLAAASDAYASGAIEIDELERRIDIALRLPDDAPPPTPRKPADPTWRHV